MALQLDDTFHLRRVCPTVAPQQHKGKPALARRGLRRVRAQSTIMVRMTAQYLVSITSEPARAHAIELTLLGHLLTAKLVRDGVCTKESDFGRVWRDHVVPIAASYITEWKAGMCAEITGLVSEAGKAFNNLVGRIAGKSPTDPERLEVLVSLPDGLASGMIKPANLKATAHPAAILFVWRHIVAAQPNEPDPFPAWEPTQGRHGHGHNHCHSHGHADERVRHLENEMLGGATLSNFQGIIDLAKENGVPIDNIIGFFFDSLVNEHAVQQIKECSTLLKALLDASDDRRRSQLAVLKVLKELVTAPKYGDVMLKKTPAIMMALYDADIIDEPTVRKWQSKVPVNDDGSGRKVREASAPFIKALQSKKHVNEHRGHGSDDADAIRNEHAHEHGGHERNGGCVHSHADCGHDHAEGRSLNM